MSYKYENLYIMHYGVGHDKGGHSGRYPWGSGKNPYGGKKNLGSMFHITARHNVAGKARKLAENRYSRYGYKKQQIADFVDAAYKNSELSKKYSQKGYGPQDFWLGSEPDTDRDRKSFLKDLLKKDKELQLDLKEFRTQRSDWYGEARDFIRNVGKDFNLGKLYGINGHIDGATAFIKSFVNDYYNAPNELSDVDELDRILAQYYW